MTTRYGLGLLVAALLGVTAPPVNPLGAEESRTVGAPPAPATSSSISADKALLDALVKDLGLSLSHPSDSNLRVPLTPKEWSFSGLRPYAALSGRVLKPVRDSLTGLASPGPESAEDFARGLGVGAGVQWRLSDRLSLFGEYLFQATPAAGAPISTPTLRPDAEPAAGLKGGLSVRF